MSKYGVIYQLQWQSFREDIIQVNMSPTDIIVDDDVDQTIYALTPSAQPLTITVTNDDQDKYSQIRSKQATIRFKSTSAINMNTFSGGPDNGWYVECSNVTLSSTIFKGFLVLDELQTAFLPNPNEVVLVASDHLGVLKEIALTDDDGNNPIGKYTLAKLITMCLRKTGMSLNLRVINNLRIDAKPNNHLYDVIYMDALSFEQEVGLSEDCYTVLQKILGEDCIGTQYKGEWWIMRLDEYEGNPLYAATFDPDGLFVSFDGAQSFSKSVGATESQRWVNADAVVMLTRPNGFIKEIFPFRYPLELVCNQDFSRGDVIDDSSTSEKTYEVECWAAFRANYPSSGLITATTNVYTKKIFDPPGYEKERYVVIEAVAAPNSNLIMSEPVYIGLRDRITMSFSRSLSADIGGSGSYTDTLAQVRFYGDDGTFWTLHGGTTTDPVPRWVQTVSDFTTVQQLVQYQGDASEDQTEVVTKTVDVPDSPVTGYIRVLLYQSALWGDIRDTHIRPVSITILPYIGGSYERFTGQFSMVKTNDPGYIAQRTREVSMSDAPRKSMKGAMLDTVIGATLFSGSIQFGAPNAFVLPGDLRATYNIGDYILITSASNSGVAHIANVIYHVVPNNTEIQITGIDITTVTEAGTIEVVTFILAEDYWASAPFALGPPPSADYLHPYGYIQAYSVWNQYRNCLRKFQGNIIWSAGDWPDLVHKYSLTDSDGNTVNRNFVLISFEQDWRTCIMSCVFVECYETAEGKIYSDPFTFKFITGE